MNVHAFPIQETRHRLLSITWTTIQTKQCKIEAHVRACNIHNVQRFPIYTNPRHARALYLHKQKAKAEPKLAHFQNVNASAFPDPNSRTSMMYINVSALSQSKLAHLHDGK